MILKENFTLNRPRQEVWDYFLDIPQVSSCVPGAVGVKELSAQTYGGSLNVRVGPISASFDGRVEIAELTPPTRFSAKFDGQDKRTATMVSGSFSADLNEPGPASTEVDYTVDVVVRGRLAQFGSTVIQATAKEMTRAFVTCVEQRLDADSAGSAETGGSDEPGVAEPPSLLTVILRAIRRTFSDVIRRLRPGPGHMDE
jgi:carbon monoxide dehydrogenase subunit G